MAEFDAWARSVNPTLLVPSMVGPGEAACPECRDIGWFSLDHPVGHPDFGKVVPCRCRAYNRGDRFLSAIIGEQAARRMTFETFVLARNPLMAEALRASRAWARGEGEPWLVLLGDVGIGKTHLALAAARVQADAGLKVVFRQTASFLNLLRASVSAEAGESSMLEELAVAQEAESLILDDFGIERTTPWVQETMDTLLDYRYLRRLPTMFTTNDLARAGERVRSRMNDGSVCRIVRCAGAKDVRPTLGQR